mgnify:CR=1 FL=1
MKLTMLLLASGLVVSSVPSMAMDNAQNMDMMDMKMKMMDPQMMDKDGDGMISRSEFMSAHEMMFDHMKNSQDMISVKDMQKMKKNMMKGKAGMSESMNPNDRDAMGRVKP